jgi:hypothetical protein
MNIDIVFMGIDMDTNTDMDKDMDTDMDTAKDMSGLFQYRVNPISG